MQITVKACNNTSFSIPGHPHPIFVGTAGWSIHKSYHAKFSPAGSHLERYARVLSGVEINLSFYRPHKPGTYERWAQSVPDVFRFAVKAPKAITHEKRMRETAELLDRFLGEVTALGSKLGPLLVQLPPSLRFDPDVVSDFFALLREHFTGEIVCEPRHVTLTCDLKTGPIGLVRISVIQGDFDAKEKIWRRADYRDSA